MNFYDQLTLLLCFLFADGNEMGISGLTNLLNRLEYIGYVHGISLKEKFAVSFFPLVWALAPAVL